MPDPLADVAEPRQRWRLLVARGAGAPDATQRDLAAAWISAIEDAGLPLVSSESTRGRSRVSFAAPLPVGMAAERELIDVVLTERWPVWRVRDALDRRIPSGWRLVDVFDVWLAGPPLAGRVAAADYRIELGRQPDARELARAASELMSAPRIPRERRKGDGTVSYDLRPLLSTVSVDVGPPPVVRTRTRFDPELGTGRPEEVIGALGDLLGVSLEVRAIVRERLLLDEDLAEAEDGTRR